MTSDFASRLSVIHLARVLVKGESHSIFSRRSSANFPMVLRLGTFVDVDSEEVRMDTGIRYSVFCAWFFGLIGSFGVLYNFFVVNFFLFIPP